MQTVSGKHWSLLCIVNVNLTIKHIQKKDMHKSDAGESEICLTKLVSIKVFLLFVNTNGVCVYACLFLREMQGVPDAVPEGAVEPPPLDTAWAESTRKKALLKLEKLDTDLKNYKGNSIKESIRYFIIFVIDLEQKKTTRNNTQTGSGHPQNSLCN